MRSITKMCLSEILNCIKNWFKEGNMIQWITDQEKIDDIIKNETAEHHLRQPIIKKG